MSTALAIVALLAALAGLGTAALGLVATWGNRRKIQEVHVIVNQRMTDVLARVDQLTAALEGSDTDVPADPHQTEAP